MGGTNAVCKSSSQKRYNHFGKVEIGVLDKVKSLRKPLKVGSKLPRATRAESVDTESRVKIAARYARREVAQWGLERKWLLTI